MLGAFAWPAALLIGWSGICLLWSPIAGKGLHDGAVYLLFYMLPLGLIAAALARLPWRIGWVKVLYVELAAMAVVFAAIGVEQYLTRTIYWNPKVKVDNAYAPVGWYFRVNSVFYDPSIYGRFLVVAILASLVLVLFERGGEAWIAAALADRDPDRPPAVVLAVELRRARRRDRGRPDRALAPEGDPAARARRGGARRRSRSACRSSATA